MGRNAHWVSQNEQRAYPLDDTATCVSVDPEADGTPFRLPQAFLADLRVIYPRSLGEYLFLGAASSTPGAVSLVLQACSTPTNSGNEHVPIASLTIAKSQLEPRRIYALRGSQPGVSGFATFGSGTELLFKSRFLGPQDGGICRRAFRATRDLPVTDMRRQGFETGLQQLVTLRADLPLAWTIETIEMDGYPTQAAVLSLRDDAQDGEDSTYLRFAGPCGRRPDSRTCLDPQPVEKIGSVGPDADGRVNLEVHGCIVARATPLEGVLVLDCASSIGETCKPPHLPNEEGLLPGDYDPNGGSDSGP